MDFAKLASLFALDCIATSVASLDVSPYERPDSEWLRMGEGLMSDWRFLVAREGRGRVVVQDTRFPESGFQKTPFKKNTNKVAEHDSRTTIMPLNT